MRRSFSLNIRTFLLGVLCLRLHCRRVVHCNFGMPFFFLNYDIHYMPIFKSEFVSKARYPTVCSEVDITVSSDSKDIRIM